MNDVNPFECPLSLDSESNTMAITPAVLQLFPGTSLITSDVNAPLNPDVGLSSKRLLPPKTAKTTGVSGMKSRKGSKTLLHGGAAGNISIFDLGNRGKGVLMVTESHAIRNRDTSVSKKTVTRSTATELRRRSSAGVGPSLDCSTASIGSHSAPKILYATPPTSIVLGSAAAVTGVDSKSTPSISSVTFVSKTLRNSTLRKRDGNFHSVRSMSSATNLSVSRAALYQQSPRVLENGTPAPTLLRLISKTRPGKLLSQPTIRTYTSARIANSCNTVSSSSVALSVNENTNSADDYKTSDICRKPLPRRRKVLLDAENKRIKSLIQKVTSFRCSFCSFLCLTEEGATRHIRDTHFTGDDFSADDEHREVPMTQYVCCECWAVFSSLKGLRAHFTTTHPGLEFHVGTINKAPVFSKLLEAEREEFKSQNSPLPSSLSITADSPYLQPLSSPSDHFESPSSSPLMTISTSATMLTTTSMSPTPSHFRSLSPDFSPTPPSSGIGDSEDKSAAGGLHSGEHSRSSPQFPSVDEKASSSLTLTSTSINTTLQESVSRTCASTASATATSKGSFATQDEKIVRANLDLKYPKSLNSDCASLSGKKRGRPKNSKNLGITNLKRTNPQMRNSAVLDREVGQKCGLDDCAIRLRSEQNLDYHRKCHEGTHFACPLCDHTHEKWISMCSHLWKVHSIDMELYACNQCNYKTVSLSKLVNLHKRSHSDDRPFPCDQCGKQFKTSKQLRNHKVIHNKRKWSQGPLKASCDTCSRKFVNKRMLEQHCKAVHDKLRPYCCSFCGYRASSRSTLKMHLRKHSGRDSGLLFNCSLCPYGTIKRDFFLTHMADHKQGKTEITPTTSAAVILSSSRPLSPSGEANSTEILPVLNVDSFIPFGNLFPPMRDDMSFSLESPAIQTSSEEGAFDNSPLLSSTSAVIPIQGAMGSFSADKIRV
ncbi:unnamed protein product [Cyprideis torosa]|uniref:Uncharacterized protein n=1 Tax=Cyprideis torosa TaxID=163714 RepID=A0A7R8W682_9CRUS|nr:unnamed protein product [Cyprideis torosa]CAG0884962.1 unnamed protein product [Cyprideis torosa]